MKSQYVDKPLTSVMWFRYVIEAINSMGLDGLRIAQESGMDIALLAIPEAVIPDEFSFKITQRAKELSGIEDFGLQAAKTFIPTALGALSYSMMTADNIDGALDRAVRYIGAMSQATSAELLPD